ncbi:hypothetical protein M406DRAFT_323017 [Cryphonectria parasitica EP155]|uniref:DUF7924 domain-containing protein n=1 Tax=Cryphonectria parasitica (strain ATCC 38755 / EP155) TaxID=660469 RepID=A0A9P5CMI6_CRYP1|nr:uncharacterized protein M406DRAFT_323017 [Cryphonectria parasitica EP155]KAF3763131.1 hypothetical protein M406DRAFT_323017 [Cryphonectria parasitica EP155]
MVVEVCTDLLKRSPEEGYTRAFNQAFTEFPKDVGFNNSLSAPQPDFVEGLDAREYRPVPVDECISGAVLYKDNPHSITLPHLAGEWKGRDQNMEKARLQSAFDGAALVYSRNQALSYIGKPDPPGHAEITTFTTNGTNLNLYAHYAALSKSGILEYHHYRVKSTSLIDTYQGHKAGRRGLRNEQDHAREQSYALRDEVTEYWMRQHHMALHTIAEEATPVPGVGPVRDEDETGNEIRRPCEPTPPISSKAHSKSSGSRSSSSTPDVGRSMQPPPRRSLRQKEKAKRIKYC